MQQSSPLLIPTSPPHAPLLLQALRLALPPSPVLLLLPSLLLLPGGAGMGGRGMRSFGLPGTMKP